MKHLLKIIKKCRKIGDELLEAYIKDKYQNGFSLMEIKKELKENQLIFSRTQIWRYIRKRK
jgi:hypothetical protein